MSLKNGLLAVLGVLLLIVGYRVLFEEPTGRLRTVPEDLLGVWVTTNPEYSDRYLEFGADFITFGTGGVNSKKYKVTGFDRDRDTDGRELNTIYFRDVDRSTFSRQFHVGSDKGDGLVFINQTEVVWVRE